MSPTRRDILKAVGGVAALLAMPITSTIAAPSDHSLKPHSFCLGVTIEGEHYSLINLCGSGPRICTPSLGLDKGSRVDLAVSEALRQMIDDAGQRIVQAMRLELERKLA